MTYFFLKVAGAVVLGSVLFGIGFCLLMSLLTASVDPNELQQ